MTESVEANTHGLLLQIYIDVIWCSGGNTPENTIAVQARSLGCKKPINLLLYNTSTINKFTNW